MGRLRLPPTYDTTRCESCGAEIIWAKMCTASRKWRPRQVALEAASDPAGLIALSPYAKPYHAHLAIPHDPPEQRRNAHLPNCPGKPTTPPKGDTPDESSRARAEP